MASLSMLGRLPDGDRAAGLAAIVEELLETPAEVRVAIVLFDVKKITVTPATGDRVPTVQIRAFEPITPTADATEMRRLLRRSVERRTGQQELPLELERELQALGAQTEDDADGAR